MEKGNAAEQKNKKENWHYHSFWVRNWNAYAFLLAQTLLISLEQLWGRRIWGVKGGWPLVQGASFWLRGHGRPEFSVQGIDQIYVPDSPVRSIVTLTNHLKSLNFSTLNHKLCLTAPSLPTMQGWWGITEDHNRYSLWALKHYPLVKNEK